MGNGFAPPACSGFYIKIVFVIQPLESKNRVLFPPVMSPLCSAQVGISNQGALLGERRYGLEPLQSAKGLTYLFLIYRKTGFFN